MGNENNLNEFETRKQDHIDICLQDEVDVSQSGLDQIQLVHEALPEIDFSEVSTQSKILQKTVGSPIFVSSMTAGHKNSLLLNKIFASACVQKNWFFAVGSQRRQLTDKNANEEWKEIIRDFPLLKVISNIGVTQLINCSVEQLEELVEVTNALGLIVHLNPLQEVLQKEGTPQFRGAFDKILEVSSSLSVPVIVKETGCGFSLKTLQKLTKTRVQAVDVSGFGGTHWGRVEGERLKKETSSSAKMAYDASQVFSNWGESTLSSLMAGLSLNPKYKLWASGGVRSGLDIAKYLSMGAQAVGLARPFLIKAMKGEGDLLNFMEQLEYELKVAMFCTGSSNIEELVGKWKWTNKG